MFFSVKMKNKIFFYHDMLPKLHLHYLFICIKNNITSLHSIANAYICYIYLPGLARTCKARLNTFISLYILNKYVLMALVSVLLMYGGRECLYTYIYHSPWLWMQQPTSYTSTMHGYMNSYSGYPASGLHTYSNCHWKVEILFTYHNCGICAVVLLPS